MRPEQLRNAVLKETTAGGKTFLVVNPQQVSGRLHIQLIEEDSSQPRFVPWDTLREKISSGLLEVHLAKQAEKMLHARTPEDDQAESEARLWLQRWLDLKQKHGVSRNQAYELLCRADGIQTDTPSRATLYRYQSRDSQGLPLLSSQREKGNRTPRYPDEVRELIANLAEQHYLQPMSRWPLRQLVDFANMQLHDQALLPEARKVSREYVSNVIHQDLTTDTVGARMPGDKRIAARAVAKQRIRVALPLQRCEQDAMHLPFVVQTPHGISRDIWLIQAIDCATSIPLGWKIIIGTPRASDTKDCLERTFFSKAAELKGRSISSDNDLYGSPAILIFDNGSENHKSRLQKLTRLGITPIHCKALAAHGKPFIERHNKSLKQALETLPGCTRFDDKDGKRDPVKEGDELMTLEELERWILRWKFERWVNTPLERLQNAVFWDGYVGQTPAEVYRTLIVEQQCAIPLPPNVKDWKAINLEEKQCTLSRKTGVKLGTFKYTGQNLPRLLEAYGEVPVTVYFDPDDFRSVWVPLGPDRVLVELTYKYIDPSTPAYNFKEAKELRDKPRVDPEGQLTAGAFVREVYERSSTDKAPANGHTGRKTSKRQQSRATTQLARQQDAEDRAAQRPARLEDLLPAQQPPLPTGLWPTTGDKVFEVVDHSKERKHR